MEQEGFDDDMLGSEEIEGGSVNIGPDSPGTAMPGSGTSLGSGGIVGARGTAEGLVIRVDGRIEPATLEVALSDFISSRRKFLEHNEVILEWVGLIPNEMVVERVSSLLRNDFHITVKSSILRAAKREKVEEIDSSPKKVRSLSEHSKKKSSTNESGLFGGVDAISIRETLSSFDDRLKAAADVQRDSAIWDDPNGRFLFATIRSGQRIESEHSLLIFGDVNSGAEIVAGGDIVVLGALRGVAHAGAYDETGGGRVIMSLILQPTQLRIGSVISRGNSENAKQDAQSRNENYRHPEVARVDGTMIVVEPYSAKSFLARRRD